MDRVPNPGFGSADRDVWMHPMETVQWLMHVDPLRYPEPAVAEVVLDEALRSGEMVASGVHLNERERREIESSIWQDYWVKFHDGSTWWVDRDPARPTEVEFGEDGPWRKVKYRRADVLRLWPAATDGEPSAQSAASVTEPRMRDRTGWSNEEVTVVLKKFVAPEKESRKGVGGRPPLPFWHILGVEAGAWMTDEVGAPSDPTVMQDFIQKRLARHGY